MPFESEAFYGRIKIGDFTLDKPQLDDLLETQPSTPLGLENIESVMN